MLGIKDAVSIQSHTELLPLETGLQTASLKESVRSCDLVTKHGMAMGQEE